MLKGLFRRNRFIVFFTLWGFAFFNLLIVVLNHYYFRTFAFDYGVYNFAFYDYAHLRVSPCPLYLQPYNITFLQDHFSLTLFFFSPLYWLLNWLTGTYTLLIIQWTCIVYGAWATYKLVELKTQDFKLGLLSLIYYFVLYGRYSAYGADCNLAIIGSALITVFLYYFEAKKNTPALIVFVFLLCNREDFPLWLIFICLLLLIIHRKDVDKNQFKLSAILLSASFLFFIITLKYIIPALEDENKKFDLFNYAALGNTPLEALQFILQHPNKTFNLLFTNPTGEACYNDVKANFYFLYLISGAFILFLRPVYLIPFIPLIAKKMFNDDVIRWSIESYYTIEVASVLPVFVFFAINEMNKKLVKYISAFLVCAGSVAVTGYNFNELHHQCEMGSDEKYNFFRKSFYGSTLPIDEIYKAYKLIPADAKVSASSKMTTHLAQRKKIYYFAKVADAEYVFLLKKGDTWPLSKENFDKELAKLTSSPDWQTLVDNKDFILLHRK